MTIRVITTPDAAELEFLKNTLLKAGIRRVERDELKAQMLPSALFQVAFWIENDTDSPSVAANLEEWW